MLTIEKLSAISVLIQPPRDVVTDMMCDICDLHSDTGITCTVVNEIVEWIDIFFRDKKAIPR